MINMFLSQGGPECIYEDESYNSDTKKIKFPIMNDVYTQSCPLVKIGKENFTANDH